VFYYGLHIIELRDNKRMTLSRWRWNELSADDHFGTFRWLRDTDDHSKR